MSNEMKDWEVAYWQKVQHETQANAERSVRAVKRKYNVNYVAYQRDQRWYVRPANEQAAPQQPAHQQRSNRRMNQA